MFYKIITGRNIKGKIIVPHDFNESCSFSGNGHIYVRAGQRIERTEIVFDQELDRDEIVISEDVMDSLLLPADIQYQVVCDEYGIKIGPIIGLILAKSKVAIAHLKSSAMANYTLAYQQIRGLLVVLCEEDLGFDKKIVKGLYYNPDLKKGSKVWIERELPFPDTIFSRAVLSEPIRLRLKEVTSNHLFNSKYFGKWDFWNMMSEFEHIREHLPFTCILSSFKDIDRMITNYGSVYLKPVNGTLARGIMKVSKTDGLYSFLLNQDTKPTLIKNKIDADNFIRKNTAGHRYLLQQALKPLRTDGRHMDFRVIMQKDQTMKWGCTGIIACIGSPGKITSNWGTELSFEAVFTERMNFNQEETFKKKQEVIRVCKHVCEALDLSGENYGDLGFDVLIDESMKVWVLEVNKRHYHVVPLWIKDVQTFYQIKTNIIKYATALSGFKVY